MSRDTFTKGDRVRLHMFKMKELGTWSVAGSQMKVIGDLVEVTGVVRHIRGNHPEHSTSFAFWVQPDGGGGNMCEKCGVGEVGPCHTSMVLEVLDE